MANDCEGTKRCSRCGEIKLLGDFYIQTKARDGRTSACRECTKAANRESGRLHRYGLDDRSAKALHDAQNGRCAICGIELLFAGGAEALSEIMRIDHDHATGAVRGLLCIRCNVGLGQARDDVATLKRAIGYLKDPPAGCTVDGEYIPRMAGAIGQQRWWNYRITPSRLEEILIAQDHKCPLCLCELDGGTETAVDHDHLTNEIRGALCKMDNTMLGSFADSIEIIEAAIEYLLDPPAPRVITILSSKPTRQDHRVAVKRSHGKARFKGVNWDAKNERWMAMVTADGKQHYLGRFEDEAQAALAVDDKLREVGRLRVNFPRVGELPACDVDHGPAPERTEFPKRGKGNRRPNRNGAKYKGVSPNGAGFQAQFGSGKGRRCLGTFATEEEAALAYNAAAIEMFGPDAYINLVPTQPSTSP